MNMKKQLLKMTEQLQKEGYNLMETPALFTWSFKEKPYVQYQLLIKVTEQGNLPLETLQ